ncbi:MAG: hypothetical protein ACOH1K_00730 [Rhodoglobus sp.]
MTALWLIAFATQLADYATARFDHQRLSRGVRSRIRLHPVAWVVPVAGITFMLIAVGVDWSTRMLFAGSDQLLAATLGFLSTVVVLIAVTAIITVVVARPPADSYRLMRDELIEGAGVRMHQDRVDEYHGRVLALTDAATARHGAAGTAGTVRASVRSLGVRTPHRLIAPVIALALLGVAIVAVATETSLPWWVLALALGCVALSVAMALAAARASLSLHTQVRLSQDSYRRELLDLLIEAERGSKKRVAGLGDRVARALSILREQQAAQ